MDPIANFQWVSDGDRRNSSRAPQGDGDADLLDAYSRAVVSVVEEVSPAVVSLRGLPGHRPAGSGSGFIISPDGMVLTNSHVVAGRPELVAETTDGDQLSGRVLGDDPATDLALVQIRARELPSIAIAQGIGFAVPSATARWVVEEIAGHGRVRRRRLGIAGSSVALSRQVIRANDLISDRGVRIAEIDPRGPAARAGLLAGDLIVAVNDRLVSGVDDLHRLLTQLPTEIPLELAVIRDGLVQSVVLTD